MCVNMPMETRKVLPGDGVTDNCDLSKRGVLNLGPQKEQQGLVINEPSLHPNSTVLFLTSVLNKE